MNEHLVIGTWNRGGIDLPLLLSQADRRQNLYVVGKSGTGKSTLIENLAVQDIQAGRGIAFVDPHGGSARNLLDYVPPDRVADVVYFDPSDEDHAVGFNLLANVPRKRRHLVASGVVGALRGIWPDSWGPRLEYILYAAVAALLDCENVSLMGVPRMLADEAYRWWVVKQVKDPMVRFFWENEFARYDKRFVQEAIAPIQNKVGQLFMAPELRNILGQVKSRFDVRSLMDNGKIFIANLSKGKIGEDKANFIGSLLITQFQLAAMSRADVPESERHDFHLYVDEVHSFVSEAFVPLLSEARKYRLTLTLAHQYLSQLKPTIHDAIIGNVGSMIAFRVGHKDAEILEKAFGISYASGFLTSLDNGQVVAKILSDGKDMEAALARTLMPQGTWHGRGERIIRRSRQEHSVGKEVIERKVEAWLRASRP
jgi:hypothetical protein